MEFVIKSYSQRFYIIRIVCFIYCTKIKQIITVIFVAFKV